jgi:hypothetical protein
VYDIDHGRAADDEALLTRLRKIIALLDPVPPSVRAAGQEAWREIRPIRPSSTANPPTRGRSDDSR